MGAPSWWIGLEKQWEKDFGFMLINARPHVAKQKCYIYVEKNEKGIALIFPGDAVFNVFLTAVFQADAGAGNASRFLLLLRLWEAQCWGRCFSFGQVSFSISLHSSKLINKKKLHTHCAKMFVTRF